MPRPKPVPAVDPTAVYVEFINNEIKALYVNATVSHNALRWLSEAGHLANFSPSQREDLYRRFMSCCAYLMPQGPPSAANAPQE